MVRALLLLLLTLLFATRAHAQDESAFELVELRVVSAQRGSAIVDHGSVDGLAVGDRVRFQPRGGAIFEGTVSRVEDRTATVDLSDPGFVPAPGTRAGVRVPKARLDALNAPKPEVGEQAAPETATEAAPEKPRGRRWRNRDEDWRQGEPLLAKVKPLKPAERPAAMTGRLYTIDDYVTSTEDERKATFLRAGGAVTYENMYGRGETLNIDGEVNYRSTDVPDNQDESKTRYRLDRASYSQGGDRFSPSRFEVGRFLQYGQPAFGVLDGAEWNYRKATGDSYGFSLGFMPEPDAEYSTGSDFQVGGYYRWVQDEAEFLSASAGFQKSLHEGSADRDLFVFDFSYLPPTGWSYAGTAWVDYYTGGDDAKGEGVDLTQLYANASRNWNDGSSLMFVATHLAFPEMERDEFQTVTLQQLADAHNDRLAMQARLRTTKRTKIKTWLGAWVDQEEAGGDGELGVEADDLAFGDSLIEVSGFATVGRFETTLGGRLILNVYGDSSYTQVFYELADHRLDEFSSANDDIPQHRVRLTREFHTNGWSVSGHFEATFYASENALSAGLYITKSF